MKKVLPILVTAIIVGAAAFYGGMKYVQGSSTVPGGTNSRNFANLTPEQRQQMMANGGVAGGAGGANRRTGGVTGGGNVNGEIISSDDKSVTLKLRDGGSKIIFFSGATQIMKAVDATSADFVAGKNIMATGMTNSDGSVSAQLIQIVAKPVGTPAGTPTTTQVQK